MTTILMRPAEDKQISQNFNELEFKCRCCGRVHQKGVPLRLLTFLEMIRAHFNHVPVTINSSFRCVDHNRAVGGADHSQHLGGKAADIDVRGIHAFDVYDYCNDLINHGGGVGRYPNFTHIDIRGHYARW